MIEFNEIFADVSNKLYGKKFVLSADKKKLFFRENNNLDIPNPII